MSESMIEKVARALYAKLATDPDWDDAPLTPAQRVTEDDDLSQQECMELARAAIEALREPTDAILEVGYPEYGLGDPDVVRELKAHWRAQIDAALEGK